MKKMANILLVLIITLILSGCFTSKDDVNKAKQNLGIIEVDKNLNNEIEKSKQEIIQNDETIIKQTKEKEVEKEKKIIIKSLTDEQYLEFDDLSLDNIFDGEVEITGKTIGNVDKIIVTFSNDTSNFPVDTYTLKQFTAGSDKFLYRAFSRYETLDFGKNTYVFEAYSGNMISKLQIVINVVKEEEKTIEEKVETIFEDISLNTLPINSTFGTPVDLGGGKISYSDLNGLEIKRDVISDLTCENLTNILTDKISTWFFWNTCRPIETDEGISFFVIRLDGDEYVYEKHYYLSYEGIYGVQELERGNGVDNTNIGEKNTELKEKNDNYSILEVSDKLFKEILK